jgi:hypothetical protein
MAVNQHTLVEDPLKVKQKNEIFLSTFSFYSFIHCGSGRTLRIAVGVIKHALGLNYGNSA